MHTISAIKGFADLFTPDSSLFSFLEQQALTLFTRYGYQELRTPILEYTELFQRSIGAVTDIVQKEMFTFPDRKGRSLTMRPEATAGIARAYLESHISSQENVSKFFTYGPMFRYERPQKGRQRQFHQLNCECLGATEPEADAEMILMLMTFVETLQIKQLRLEINNLGCQECRPSYIAQLKDFLHSIKDQGLCENCLTRMETNPLRVLDCKEEACQKLLQAAPKIYEHTCAACQEHFSRVLTILDAYKVAYTLNASLVRGLDYYTRTAFELVSENIGAQGSIAGGGRYNGLLKQLGGPETPGVGFACGMERFALLLADNANLYQTKRPDFYIVCLAPNSNQLAILIAQQLRVLGLQGSASFAVKGLKGQMRQASKNNSRYCIILGEDELANSSLSIKNMDSGEQEIVAQKDIAKWAQKIVE